MKTRAVDIIESYHEIFYELDEELSIIPLKLIGDILYFKVAGTPYGYKAIDSTNAPELWRKFKKMVEMYHAGGKAFVWLKKSAKHVYGGKTGEPVPLVISTIA